MNCPNCGSAELVLNEPADGLHTLRCNGCWGRWVDAQYYWEWLEKRGGNEPEQTATDTPPPRMAEVQKTRVCPHCTCLMTRYDVGHGVNFAVDRCPSCGGFWLDRGEFEQLEERGLHDDLHLMFSQTWQQQVRRQREGLAYENRMRLLLGKADYDEAFRLRDWIGKHKQRASLIAYLSGR